jgi:hypothetical protein
LAIFTGGGEDFARSTRILFMSKSRDQWRMAEMCIAGCEPALDEMLGDPMTKALMASDGVEAKEVKSLLAEARARSMKRATGEHK